MVFCHARFSWLAGGYVGVDVFFVISGYVVCLAILHEQQAGTFGLKQFYVRRMKRLAPSLYLVMAATLLACLWLCFPDNNLALVKNIGFVTLFASNVYLARQTGYFDLGADKHPLLHTWSLSVEEQFYLLIPLVLIWLQRHRAPARLAIAAALWALAFAWSCHAVAQGSAGSYYYLQGRLFEFLCGIVLAVLFQAWPVRTRHLVWDLLLLAGLALMVWCATHYGAGTAMPGVGALWPCLGAMLAIAGAQGARYSAVLLANRACTFVGKVSYVFYLWHWPVIFMLGRLELKSPQWMLAAIAASFALAVLTHYRVEQPLRRAQWRPRQTWALLFALPLCVTLSLLALGRYTDNFVAFFPEPYQKDYRESGRTVFNDARASDCWSKEAVTPAAKCTVGDAASPRKAVLLGDSHAYHLISFMDRLGKDNHLAIHDMTFTMCAPIENSPPKAGDPAFQRHAGQCRAHGLAVMQHVLSQPDIGVVIMAAVWDLYENDAPGAQPAPTGHGYLPGQFRTELARTIAQLQAAGKQVVFADDIPLLPPELEDCVSNRLYLPQHQGDHCTYSSRVPLERYQRIDAVLSHMQRRFAGLSVIHTFDVPCRGQVCHAELQGVGLYSHNDRGHLGAGGSTIYYDEYLKRHPGEASAILQRGLVAGAGPATAAGAP